jgi:hypothetical protein
MSKSQQPQQKIIKKQIELSKPIKIKLSRGSRGVRWEISVHAATVDDAMSLLRQAEEKLNARYGLHAALETEQKATEKEFPLARNGLVYGSIVISSRGVVIRPAGVKIYTTDAPVGWLFKKFLPGFTKNAKIKVEEQNGELQSIEIRDWKPDMKSLNELAERAAWSFSTAATKPPKQQQPKSQQSPRQPQQPQKKQEGESK